MKPSAPIKLVSQLLDLPIIDSDGRWCGIVDDVELKGAPGKDTRLAALLVGPGAYEGRFPKPLFALVRMIAGDGVRRVPVAEIETIRSAVHLKCKADDLKLHRSENRVRAWIPRRGAL